MNAPVPPRATLALRILRSVAIVGLALAVTLVLFIFVAGLLPATAAAFSSFASDSAVKISPAAIIVLVVAILVGPAVVVSVLQRKGWLTGRVLLVGWAVMLPICLWLARDDAEIRRPLPLEEFSPAFPGAAESFAVVMRYGSRSEDAASQAFLARKFAVQFSGTKPTDATKWRDFVTAHRAGLATDWEAIAPERRWLEELAAFDRIGDLTEPSIAADIPRFAVWRAVSQRTAAHASLLALDGRGDDAIAALLPLLEVSRKLEPFSRTLVRTMIARVCHRLAVDAAGFVLDHATVSPELKARLAASLGPIGGTAGVRRVVLMEYASFMPLFGHLQLGQLHRGHPLPAPVRYPLNAVGALLFQPCATANRYGDFAYELAALAEQRDLAGFVRRQEEFSRHFEAKFALKNLGGRLLLATFVPAYQHIVKNYWDTEDQRAALAARLRP